MNAQNERKEIGNLVIEGIPDIPERISERIFQYQNTRGVSFSGWLPSGKEILIRTRFGETNQVHKVDMPGGARKQLTFFPEPVNGASICPDSSKNTFLFIKDIGGGEFYQVFSFDMKTGIYKMLTDGKSRNSNPDWSNKGDKFTFSTTKRNGKDTDVYLMDIENNSEVSLITEGGNWSAIDWSPDDSKLLAVKYVSANESYIYLLDLITKKLEQLNPSSEKIAYNNLLWSKDGKGIFIVSDEGSEFQQLKYYDIATKKFAVITNEINWNVDEIELSENGEMLAFTINKDGMSKLYLMDTKTKIYNQVEIPTGLTYSLQFNQTDEELGMVINTPKSPGDFYSLNLKNNILVRWTFSEVGGLNTDNFVNPELIYFPTFDEVNGNRRMIPAFYYKPQKTDSPFPVLIDIHGGPESQEKPSFSSFIQYLVNEMGIAIILPNVRGSSGYGKTYLKLDNEYKREESVQDIGKLIEWINEQPELDASKIAVYGGSYGGYMVLASMVHFNEKIKCGIDVVGISNFVTFLENTQDYRRDLRRVEYGDERDPNMREYLEKIAPLNNVKKISKPLFVVQGLNDPRVPVTEAEQIVKAVRENGRNVWYLLAKDEGHGFQKKVNRDYLLNSTILFLEENLLK
ncbi:MAG: hypothetical protein A2V93_09455 [Ignavibacteria bacterium RBG_16_34_14]|nr:MAG: hypothetical protein A2V93_09455 [Ignavibacteria bacterium RBG_16_34_14]